MSLSVRADYFNQTRRIWEPLLEPFAAEGALTREGTKGTDVTQAESTRAPTSQNGGPSALMVNIKKQAQK